MTTNKLEVLEELFTVCSTHAVYLGKVIERAICNVLRELAICVSGVVIVTFYIFGPHDVDYKRHMLLFIWNLWN